MARPCSLAHDVMHGTVDVQEGDDGQTELGPQTLQSGRGVGLHV